MLFSTAPVPHTSSNFAYQAEGAGAQSGRSFNGRTYQLSEEEPRYTGVQLSGDPQKACMDHIFTTAEAKAVGDMLGIDWDRINLEDFRIGMNVELEHGTENPQTNITNNDPIVTGKIALAHLRERPDYYKLLIELEEKPEFTRDF